MPNPAKRRGSATHCVFGHSKDYVYSDGRRGCRICTRNHMRKRTEARRKQRLRERRRRLAKRPVPPKGDRVWAAGHFEGEGTISILSGGAKRISRPHIALASTDKAVIDFFQATWRGHVSRFLPYSTTGRAREAFRWDLNTNDTIEGFLRDLLPHLKTERVRAKAELLLEDIRKRVVLRRTAKARQGLLDRMARMRALNRRGKPKPGDAQ